MFLSPQQESDIFRIGKHVAKKSRLTDKEEALSVALLGIAKGLDNYDPEKDAKWTTYIYRCAQLEVWCEWRKQNTIKRGSGIEPLSLDELQEQGMEF